MSKNEIITANKDDFTINNDELLWNPKIIAFLIKMGKITMHYRCMHEIASQQNHKLNRNYKIAEAIFTVLITVIQGSEVYSLIFGNGLDSDKTLLLCLGSIAIAFLIIAGIIIGIKHVSEFEKFSIEHEQTAIKFGEINLSIQNQLSLNLKDRDNDRDFLKYTIKSFNDLMNTAPKLDISIKCDYLNNKEDNDIFNIEEVVTKYNNYKEDDKAVDYQLERWLKN